MGVWSDPCELNSRERCITSPAAATSGGHPKDAGIGTIHDSSFDPKSPTRSYHCSRKMTTEDLRRAQSQPIVRTLSVAPMSYPGLATH